MREFNLEGPMVAEDHYLIPPLDRMDLASLRHLVARKRYFVLHAPRQTGKTSALLALRDLFNDEGDYSCVYVNVECATTAREDVESAIRTVLNELAESASDSLGDRSLQRLWPDVLARAGGHSALRVALTRWSRASPRPLVLLIDEIDAMVGDSLLAVLRQLRAGYYLRPKGFPQSVVLCGVRDVRDYRIHSSSANTMILGGSAFNVKARSLRLGDFSRNEVVALLGQHTHETGQEFTEEAQETVWRRTRGQPWLVNALAYETCFAGTNRPRGLAPGGHAASRLPPVTEDDVLGAQEALIVRRETHLDQLVDKLQEERVRRVVEPILAGADKGQSAARDLEYVRDLGLVARDAPIRIANPIYAEVVPRELAWIAQEELPHDPAWYVNARGGLEIDKLLDAFQDFFREHSEHWVERFQYKEAGPQLLLQAFLQRVVNSGGRIEREYGMGRGRTDLLVVWPQGERTRRYVVECKVRHPRRGLERTVADGVEQTAAYMDRCRAEAGCLVVFDRNEERSWDEKTFHERRTAPSGTEVAVWGM